MNHADIRDSMRSQQMLLVLDKSKVAQLKIIRACADLAESGFDIIEELRIARDAGRWPDAIACARMLRVVTALLRKPGPRWAAWWIHVCVRAQAWAAGWRDA